MFWDCVWGKPALRRNLSYEDAVARFAFTWRSLACAAPCAVRRPGAAGRRSHTTTQSVCPGVAMAFVVAREEGICNPDRDGDRRARQASGAPGQVVLGFVGVVVPGLV